MPQCLIHLNGSLVLVYPDDELATGWRKCVGCLVSAFHFPQKNPTLSGSFAEKELQHQVSS